MTRAQIVAATRRWIGTPYHHQASLRGIGCDCLGLVRGVWRECLGSEPEVTPPYSPDWAEQRGEETLLNAASRHFIRGTNDQHGSVLLFRWKADGPAKHIGISVGDGRFVHAYDAAGRAVEGMMAPIWSRRLVATFEFQE